MAQSVLYIELVVAEFEKQLTHKEKEDFEHTTLQDVQQTIRGIQKDQEELRRMMNLRRLQLFIDAMDKLDGAMAMFWNTSSLSCYIWGPLKHILLLARTWEDSSLEIVLDAYQRLGENLPLFSDLPIVLTVEEVLVTTEVLVNIYEDVIRFNLKVVQLFRPPIWKTLFRSSWRDSQPTFTHILNNLSQNRAFLDGDPKSSQIEKWRQTRLQSESSFAALENERKQREMRCILDWLLAPDVNIALEYYLEQRQEYPAIGRWILDEAKVRAWLEKPHNPYLWITGKPGSGKTFLASIIIEEARALSESSLGSSVAYFFSQPFGLRITFSYITSTLLSQLLCQNPSVSPYLYEESISSGTARLSSPKECIKLLGVVLQAVPKPVIILDGIDEVKPSERKILLDFFAATIDGTNPEAGNTTPSCLFVSRELDQIKEILPMASVLKLEDHHFQQDARQYVTHQFTEITEKFELSEKLRVELIERVCELACGTIGDTWCILEVLLSQSTKEALFSKLRDLNILPENNETAFLFEGFRQDTDLVPCPTVVSGDSGYGSMAPRINVEDRRRKKMDSDKIAGDVQEWDLRSVASLESHATDITMSSVNPAAAGGAAEQLAEFLLLNNDIRSLLAEGFQTMESDKFERNFRRLLKDYASSLRKEAKDTLEKGATTIVHTYRAYVTRIIRSKFVGSKVESHALAFHEIKSQQTSKVTLERFLEQFQVPKDHKRLEEDREDLESEAGSKFSDDEQPYLPNLEKVTDFLVSSAAFEAFKVALCAFVRPGSGHGNSAAQAPSRGNTHTDDSMQIDPDILSEPNMDELQIHVSKKRPPELDNDVEHHSKRLKIGTTVNEDYSADGNATNMPQSPTREFTHTGDQYCSTVSLKKSSSPADGDIDMLDVDGGCFPSPVTGSPIHIELAERNGDEHNYSAAHLVLQSQNPLPVGYEQLNDVKSSLGSLTDDVPRLPLPHPIQAELDLKNSRMNNRAIQEVHQPNRNSNSFVRPESSRDVGIQVDIESTLTFLQSIPDRNRHTARPTPPQFKESNLHIGYKVKNAIKRFVRPPVPPGFQRIEWTCDCGDLLYADFSEKCPERLAAISSQLKSRPIHSIPLRDNTIPRDGSTGQLSVPPPIYVGHTPISNRSMAQSVGPGFNERSEASNLLDLRSTGSCSQSAFQGPMFFELCVNAGTFLKSLAEIDLKDTKTDGEFFQAVREHYFRMRSYRARFWLLKPSTVSYVRFSVEERRRVGLLQKPGIIALPPKSEVDEKRYDYNPCPLDDELPISSDLFLHYVLDCSAPSRALIWLPRIPRKLATSIFTNHGPAGFGWGVHIDEGPDFLKIFLLNLEVLLLSGGAALLWNFLKNDFQGAFGFACWIIAVLNTVMAVFVVKWRQE